MKPSDLPAGLTSLSAPVRRFLAIGLVVVVGASAWAWIYQPVLRWVASQLETLADARFDLERLRATSQSLAGVSPDAVQAEEARLRALLLPGESDAEATLALQSAVGRLLSAPGIAVEGMRAEGVQELAGVKVVSVSWRGVAEEQALTQALAQIEQANPILKIDRVILRSAGGDRTASRVSADIRVSAFWTGSTGSPALGSTLPPGAR